MIDAATIDKIISLAPVQKFVFGNREYTSETLRGVKAPVQSSLTVSTLTAIEDYFRDNPDNIDLTKAVVHIKSAQVDVMSCVTNGYSVTTMLTPRSSIRAFLSASTWPLKTS